MCPSHPARVRGLKLMIRNISFNNSSRTLHGCVDWNLSLSPVYCISSCRTLHGCVDWNFNMIKHLPICRVAPCTGAWIEISADNRLTKPSTVAPCTGAWIEISIWFTISNTWFVAPCTGAWIEIRFIDDKEPKILCRTLHGCVDWNIDFRF